MNKTEIKKSHLGQKKYQQWSSLFNVKKPQYQSLIKTYFISEVQTGLDFPWGFVLAKSCYRGQWILSGSEQQEITVTADTLQLLNFSSLLWGNEGHN